MGFFSCAGGKKAQAGRRFISAMPSATAAIAASTPGVTASPSHKDPPIRVNSGVKKEKLDTRVAG
jgi:hypothetical protein